MRVTWRVRDERRATRDAAPSAVARAVSEGGRGVDEEELTVSSELGKEA